MKKKVIGLAAMLLLVAGCGKVPKLENGKDAVVSFNNGEKISVDDLYEEMKDTYALQTLVNMIDKYVMETSFKDYKETAEEYAESYMSALRENYQSDDEFLDAIRQYTGMSSIEAYENNVYLGYMQTHAAEEYAKLQITDKQIKNYYEKEAVGDIEISHILITPKVTDDMNEEDQEKAEKTALNKANKLIEELKDKSGDELTELFTTLAKENSDDDATKDNAGSLGKLNKMTASSSYKELLDEAYNLKDGKVSTKAVKSELGYHIIYKTKSYEKDTLENLSDTIRKNLASELQASNSKIGYEALQYYRKELGMSIEDNELKTQYAYYMNNALTNLNNNSNN